MKYWNIFVPCTATRPTLEKSNKGLHCCLSLKLVSSSIFSPLYFLLIKIFNVVCSVLINDINSFLGEWLLCLWWCFTSQSTIFRHVRTFSCLPRFRLCCSIYISYMNWNSLLSATSLPQVLAPCHLCCKTHSLYLHSVLFLLVLLLYVPQLNRYGHGGTVSSPDHTFSWASLNKHLTST